MDITEFYQQCAIGAMQGIQENGTKFGLVADFLPKELAMKAFDIADAMVIEYRKRIKENKEE